MAFLLDAIRQYWINRYYSDGTVHEILRRSGDPKATPKKVSEEAQER